MLGATSNNLPLATESVSHWLGNGASSHISVGLSVSTTHERKLDAHEHLFLASSPQKHIYQVLEGVIGSYNLLGDGRRQIVTFYYPGDLIGVEDSGTWEHYGEALCSAKVRAISVDTIDRLFETEPKFGQAVVATLAMELAETRDQLLSLGRKSALEKVATFLMRISKRNLREQADETRLHLPMTRAEIADYLGLTVETISRNFTKLRKAKIIELQRNCNVHVIDMDQLEDIALGDA